MLIQPGTTPGTRYCFKEQGDQSVTRIPADITFITQDKPHKWFKRRNLSDLTYEKEIDLCDALIGVRFVIPTLDKRTLKISITDVIRPGYIHMVPKEGLPKCVIHSIVPKTKEHRIKPKEFGDLYIEFKSWFTI